MKHLQRTAFFIRVLDSATYSFAALAGLLAIWLIGCLVDHWVWALPVPARWVVFAASVAFLAWLLIGRLLPLLLHRINLTYAAKRVEQLVPEFKNGLVTWLELETIPDPGVPPGVLAALAYRAKKFIGGHDPSSIVDISPLIRAIAAVLLMALALVLYAVIVPKSILDTGRRLAMPWSDVDAPTRVQLLKVTPGNAVLTLGAPLEVHAEIRGLRNDEPAWLMFSTADGQLVDQRIEMTAVTEGFHYAGILKTGAEGVEHELEYWVEAGDARGRRYRVKINPRPRIVLQSIELIYPAYTQLPPRTVARDQVEAVEGTVARIHAEANQPLKSARIEINPQLDASGRLVRAQSIRDMQVDRRSVIGDVLMQLNENRDNPTPIQFRLRAFNTRGDTNPEPILYHLSALADLAPEVQLLGPASRVVRAVADARLRLEVVASDPDYGLTELTLVAQHADGRRLEQTFWQHAGKTGRQTVFAPLDLPALDARVGDKYLVSVRAKDNRHDPVTGKPAPNVAESEPLMIAVVGPQDLPPEQVKAQRNPPTDPSDSGMPEPAPQEATGRPTPDEPSASASASAQGSSSDTANSDAANRVKEGSDRGAGSSSNPDSDANAGADAVGGASGAETSSSEAGSETAGETSTSNARNNDSPGNSAAAAGVDGQGSSERAGDAAGRATPSDSDMEGQTGSVDRSASSAGPNGSDGSNAGAGTPPRDDAEVIRRVKEFLERKKGDPPRGEGEESAGPEPTPSPEDAAGSTSDSDARSPNDSNPAGGDPASADNSSPDNNSNKAPGAENPSSGDGASDNRDGSSGGTESASPPPSDAASAEMQQGSDAAASPQNNAEQQAAGQQAAGQQGSG
ncbi:MAG: hypothetical protein D6753_11635, partial [Planctomycetota bacterium]